MTSRRRADLLALACLVFSMALVAWDVSRRHAAESLRLQQASASAPSSNGSLSRERDIETALGSAFIEPSMKHLSRFHVHLTFGDDVTVPTRMRVVLRTAVHREAGEQDQLRQKITRKLQPEYPRCALEVNFEEARETVTPMGSHYDL